MIEVVFEDRCTACNTCVTVCPNVVFDAVPGDVPAIARQEECHTCYMCEAHCPVDALWVSPYRDPAPVDREQVLASGLVGSFRRALGFDTHKPGTFAYIGPAEIRQGGSANAADKVRAQLAELSERALIVPERY